MNTWRKQKFGDLLEEKTTFLLKKGFSYSFIPMESISSAKRSPAIREKQVFTGSGSRFMNGDTLFARITPCLQNRKIVYANNLEGGVGFGSTEYFVFRAKPEIADNLYIYYLSNLDEFRHVAELSMTGASGRQRADEVVLRRYEAKVPDLLTQQHIASVLAAYDDLIENNEKRINILEEMAQRLYTEWFVKFKFPGYKKSRMVESGTEFGKIPEGWEVAKIGEEFTTILGGTPSRAIERYWLNGTITWINSGKVNELRIVDESEMITKEALDKSATKMMPKRTTLLAITGATLGQVSLTEIECCANQSVVGIYDPEGLFNEYLYLKIKQIIKNIIALASGGAQQHINKDIVNSTEIIIPDKQFANLFLNKIKPVFDEISLLMFKNKILQKTRDLLIPQLVTGKRLLK